MQFLILVACLAAHEPVGDEVDHESSDEVVGRPDGYHASN